MARLASIFAALSGGTTVFAPDMAQPAALILLGSTMVVLMSLSRRRVHQIAAQVTD